MTIESQAGPGKIAADIQAPERSRPETILLRLRHPQARPTESVTVNGRPWTDFNKQKECVRIQKPVCTPALVFHEVAVRERGSPRANVQISRHWSLGGKAALRCRFAW